MKGNTGQMKEEQWLTLVRQQVESLRYGVVQIIVHDGRVTQIEKTEKLRLEQVGNRPATSTGVVGDETERNSEEQADRSAGSPFKNRRET